MQVDKELIQDVIDRIIKFDEKYVDALKKLNTKFKIKIVPNTIVRTYEKDDNCIGDRP